MIEFIVLMIEFINIFATEILNGRFNNLMINFTIPFKHTMFGLK